MKAWIKKLFARATRPITTAKPDRGRTRLGTEMLEAREMPAYLWNGSLVIDGTNSGDSVFVNDSDGVTVTVVENGWWQWFSHSAITTGQVYFRGNAGSDNFSIATRSLQVIANGGD